MREAILGVSRSAAPARRRLAIVLLAGALASLGPAQVNAGYCTTLPEGCYKCEYNGPLSNESHCAAVTESGWGDGSLCRNCNVMGWICLLGGTECVTVTPGGGGGGGGAGGGGTGGECTIRPGAWCPASCMSCTVQTY